MNMQWSVCTVLLQYPGDPAAARKSAEARHVYGGHASHASRKYLHVAACYCCAASDDNHRHGYMIISNDSGADVASVRTVC